MGREPTIIIQSVVAALNAVQLAAISMPTWTHIVALALIVGLGTYINRGQVTPVGRCS